jgi:hypothetical protein
MNLVDLMWSWVLGLSLYHRVLDVTCHGLFIQIINVLPSARYGLLTAVDMQSVTLLYVVEL